MLHCLEPDGRSLMARYEDMSRADLAKALRCLVAYEARALWRAERASSASISRSATIQAAGYAARRQTVEQLLTAPLAP